MTTSFKNYKNKWTKNQEQRNQDGKTTQVNAPYLFNSKGRCEIKLKDLATMESLANNKPILKILQEIVEVLNLGNSEMDIRLTKL